MILDGSFELYNQFFDEHDMDKPAEGWSWLDSYPFTEKQMEWFYEKGCKWIKLEADPGDLLLWDSRAVHYGAHAEGDNPRFAMCESPPPYSPCLHRGHLIPVWPDLVVVLSCHLPPVGMARMPR